MSVHKGELPVEAISRLLVKAMGQERECVKIPSELLGKVDELVAQLDFKSREVFVEAAVRRFIDFYLVLTPKTRKIK